MSEIYYAVASPGGFVMGVTTEEGLTRSIGAKVKRVDKKTADSLKSMINEGITIDLSSVPEFKPEEGEKS